jgi:1-acyl-sn-glycerol-3-phosphate acyltransferase
MGLFDQDNEPLQGAALAAHIQQALATPPPSGPLQEISYQLVKRIYRPLVLGADNLPDRPCLFVGNHSLFALDGMILLPLMLGEYGRFLRPMGDKFLFTLPATRQMLVQRGAVIGNPDVCGALMRDGQDLLVFPGGAHEAVKPAADKYALQWKERYGFVKLAARHGYTVMPFALVGPDEFYAHLIEGKDLPHTGLGRLLQVLGIINERTRSDMLPPVPIGALGTALPKPQRCYLQFGEPVDLAPYRGKRLGKAQQRKIRDGIGQQIEGMLRNLLLVREQRKGENGFLRRLLTL